MSVICGMDECGRGPLAGPIVAAAVVLSAKCEVLRSKLNDSKKLSAKKRNILHKKLLKSGSVIEIEIISVRQINSQGIGWANKELFKRLAKKVLAEKYIVDGNLKLGKKITSLVKADTKIPEVMAASIVAKVTRDKIMRDLHEQFPHYGWQSNMGYGTKYHISALREHGPTKHHRKLFVSTALKPHPK